MPSASIIIGALACGLLACGCFIAWLLRREPRKSLNIVVLALGVALLAYSHLQWAVHRESPEVIASMFIRHLIAGWSLTAMGFIGLQCGGRPPKQPEE